MVRRRAVRWTVLAAACLVLAGLCTACGGSEELVEVHIRDGQVETVVDTAAGETVEQILGEAEITLGPNDAVTPELSGEVTGDGTQIVIERYAAVTVRDGEDVQSLSLTGKTVGDALEAASVTLGENDLLNHSPQAYLSDGMDIVVERRYSVHIVLDGGEEDVVTGNGTVEELLEEMSVSLGDEDRVDPAPETRLADGMEVIVNRVTRQRVTETEEIDYETEYENTSDLYTGDTQVKQSGKKGTKELIYEVVYVDGEEESRELVGENVTEEPVNEIILKGTKQKVTSSSSSSSGSSSSSSGSSSGSSSKSGKSVVSKVKHDDCDGSGHGYYVITYSDGSVEYQDY